MAVDFVNWALALSYVLATVVGVVFWIVVIWGIAQLVGVAKDGRAYLRDLIGFRRGKVKKAAELKGIEILYEAKAAASEVDQILAEAEEKKLPSRK